MYAEVVFFRSNAGLDFGNFMLDRKCMAQNVVLNDTSEGLGVLSGQHWDNGMVYLFGTACFHKTTCSIIWKKADCKRARHVYQRVLT